MSSTLNMSTAVFASKEIFTEILSYLPRQDCVSCAAVVKSWTDASLDAAWSVVDNLKHFLSLLSPLKRPRARGPYQFSRPLEYEDWQRFEKVARRVRVLSLSNSMWGTFHDDVTMEIALSRTRLDVMPNLHTIEWTMDLRLLYAFIHPRVRTLRLLLSADHIEAMRGQLASLFARAPNLRTLHIDAHRATPRIDQDLLHSLPRLPQLERVVLPIHYVTPALVNGLKELAGLLTVSMMDITPDDIYAASLSVASSNGSRFSSMQVLSREQQLSTTASRIGRLSASFEICELAIYSQHCETTTSIFGFLQSILSSLPSLERLTISPFVGCRTPHVPQVPEPLDLTCLHPILNFSKLSLLILSHQCPLQLTMAELEGIAKALPNIEVCYLNPAPYVRNEIGTALSLEAIGLFSQFCPNLRSLGLFVDATIVQQHRAPERTPSNANIEHLELGCSPISNAIRTAMYICRFVRDICRVSSTVSWKDTNLDRDDPAGKCRQYQALWRQVNGLLPEVVRFRAEEREMVRSDLAEELNQRAQQSAVQPVLDDTNPPLEPPQQTSADADTPQEPTTGGSSTAESDTPSSDHVELLPGTVVRAMVLIPGQLFHTWWPGVIVDPSTTPQEFINQVPDTSDTSLCVVFFPRGEYARLNRSYIKPLKKEDIPGILANSQLTVDQQHGYLIAYDPKAWLAANRERERLLAIKKELEQGIAQSALATNSASPAKSPEVSGQPEHTEESPSRRAKKKAAPTRKSKIDANQPEMAQGQYNFRLETRQGTRYDGADGQ